MPSRAGDQTRPIPGLSHLAVSAPRPDQRQRESRPWLHGWYLFASTCLPKLRHQLCSVCRRIAQANKYLQGPDEPRVCQRYANVISITRPASLLLARFERLRQPTPLPVFALPLALDAEPSPCAARYRHDPGIFSLGCALAKCEKVGDCFSGSESELELNRKLDSETEGEPDEA